MRYAPQALECSSLYSLAKNGGLHHALLGLRWGHKATFTEDTLMIREMLWGERFGRSLCQGLVAGQKHPAEERPVCFGSVRESERLRMLCLSCVVTFFPPPTPFLFVG